MFTAVRLDVAEETETFVVSDTVGNVDVESTDDSNFGVKIVTIFEGVEVNAEYVVDVDMNVVIDAEDVDNSAVNIVLDVAKDILEYAELEVEAGSDRSKSVDVADVSPVVEVTLGIV